MRAAAPPRLLRQPARRFCDKAAAGALALFQVGKGAFSRLLFRVSSSPSRHQAAGGRALRVHWLGDRACGGPAGSRRQPPERQAAPLRPCPFPPARRLLFWRPLLRAPSANLRSKPARQPATTGAQLGLGRWLGGRFTSPLLRRTQALFDCAAPFALPSAAPNKKQ